MMHHNKGIAGLTTLLLFLTFIIIALAAATLLLQTGNQLQQEGTTAATQAQKQTSTKLHVLSVTGQDARDEDVELFCEFVKLAPGSAPVRMDSMSILFETPDILRSYISGTRLEPMVVGGGWQTVPAELFDIDGDGLDDSVHLIASYLVNQNEHLEVRASSDPLEFVRFNTGRNLETAGTTPISYAVYGESVSGTGSVSGRTYTIQWSIVGTTNVDRAITDDVFFAVSTKPNVPADAGVFSVYNTHDPTGGQNNVLRHNHVSRICLATEDVPSETNVKLQHIPMYGSVTTAEFTTPDIMNMQKIDLYPWYEG